MLSVPKAKDRRDQVMNRAKDLYDQGWEIKAIAAELNYTARGMKLLLQNWFTAHGQTMPDVRSRLGGQVKAY